MTLKYNVAYSGSTGNAVKIENCLFDIGRSFKEIDPLLTGVKAIFISHKHPDHLNISTYNNITLYHPTIKIFANYDVFMKLKVANSDLHNFYIVKPHEKINIQGNIVEVFQTKHEKGVITDAYLGITKNLETFVFGTDFYSFDDLPQGKYDYLFVEANHDENYKEFIAKKSYNGDISQVPGWLIHSTERHTSKQDALKYYVLHRKNINSKFIPLHKSSRFYDLEA